MGPSAPNCGEVARILIETFLSAYADRKVSIKILATSINMGLNVPHLGLDVLHFEWQLSQVRESAN